jgi:DNA ligase-1
MADAITLETFWDSIETLTATRSTNAKQVEVERIMDEWPRRDAYLSLQYFTGSVFPDPDRAKDFGTAHLRDAYIGRHGESEAKVRDRIDELGDVSKLWPVLDSGKSISFRHAHDIVDELWAMSGDNPIIRRIGTECDRVDSPRALAWMLVTDISLGMGSATVRDAFASRYGVDRDTIDRSYGALPDVAEMFDRWESDGFDRIEVEPGRPTNKQKANSRDIPLDSDEWAAEVKYDGARIFIHRTDDGEITAYTGGRQEITHALPELYEIDWPDTSFVVDGEVVAYDDEDADEPLPFQNVMRRLTRENGVIDSSEEYPVKFHLFDLIYWKGGSLIDEEYRYRSSVLRGMFPDEVLSVYSTDVEECYEWAMDNGHEGIIAKRLDSPYQFTRSANWRKRKPEPEKLDLRITEVQSGSGEMAGMMGALRLETSDGEDLGCVGTGFSDAEREEFWSNRATVVGDIVEVEYEELQTNGSGYGLRFVSFNRRRPEGDCDSMDRVLALSEGVDG